MTEQPSEENEPAVPFKLLVTIALVGIMLFGIYTLYSGATGPGELRRLCNKAKDRPAEEVLAELGEIATPSEPSPNGTVVVQHPDGPRCVVRVTDGKVFSALFEE